MIKKVFIISQKKFFLYFGKWNFLVRRVKISGGNFSSSKNEKKLSLKKFLIIWEMKRSSQKKLLYFS